MTIRWNESDLAALSGGGNGRIRKRLDHRESREVQAFIEWRGEVILVEPGRYPGLHLLHATLNGVRLSGNMAQRARTWKRLVREGAQVGVHDLLLPVARGVFHGLWIEAKADKGKPTTEQLAWQREMWAQAYAAQICYGCQEMIKAIEWYYALPHCQLAGLSGLDADELQRVPGVVGKCGAAVEIS